MDKIYFLIPHLGAFQAVGKEVLFICPFCQHHKKKLSVNILTLAWKCWVCDEKGRSILSLLWKIGNKDVLNAYKASFEPIFASKSQTVEEKQPFLLKLPEEYIPLGFSPDCFERRRFISYLRKRGIEHEDIRKYKIGFSKFGTYRNRLFFPSFDASGFINFYTARTIDKTEWMKYINPDVPHGYKNKIILNELNVDWSQPIILTEGFIDMVKIDGNCVPLFGSSLSEDSKLFSTLVLNQCKVYLCLDSDARKKQIRLMEALIQYGIEVFDVKLHPFADAGEMKRSDIHEKLQSAKKMNRISLLREKMHV
jgi:hypothetical protein